MFTAASAAHLIRRLGCYRVTRVSEQTPFAVIT